MNNKIYLDINYDMYDYFRQMPEFIFIDSIEVEPGIYAEGVKKVEETDWYFQYHFPGNPIMPGVFQMEALMQTGGLIINTLEGKKELKLYFGECKSVRINESVRPGDVLKTIVTLKTYRRGIAWFDAKAMIGDKISCKMQFSLIAPDEVGQIMNHKSMEKDNE
ncbi:MAG: 3-hydroxyacyl-ACP dehydratase FabZ family protein [Lachnotalea sp.]